MIEKQPSSQIEEKPNMAFSSSLLTEIESYSSDPLENMTIHDALITIALYICMTSKVYIGYHHTIDKTLDLAEKSPLFGESSEDILCRIYKRINLFRVTAPNLLFQEALKTLPEELRQIAFDWAFELVTDNGKFSTQNPFILRNLAKKFGYQDEKAKEIISAKLGHEPKHG